MIPEFGASNNKKYGVEVIKDIAVYTKKKDRYLLKL